MRCLFWILCLGLTQFILLAAPIDRQALVSRHNPVLQAVSPGVPLSVGNGAFAFNVDVTGLQTFQSLYTEAGMPLETLGRAFWHSEPNPEAYTLADASSVMDTAGRPVAYPVREKTPAGQWLRRNPHLFPLGQLGFCDASGAPLDPTDLTEIEQRLDLWTGLLHSRWKWRGVPVEVETCAGGTGAVIGVRIQSSALADGSLRVSLRFPRGHDLRVKNTPPLDWSEPTTHRTQLDADSGQGLWRFTRLRDDLRYRLQLLAGSPLALLEASSEAHAYLLSAEEGASRLELRAEYALADADFSREAPGYGEAPRLGSFDWISISSMAHWMSYWSTGAALDLSGSTDPRAAELERRVVLSRYLCEVNIGGSMPPQETGLTCNSWYGKHHTEMVWWHVAHFALWGHPEKVEEALVWFDSVLPQARQTAAARGLKGARWSKMVGPDGRESPGGTALIWWNQPHPIHLAELVWRAKPEAATLERWKTVVFETADCLASMAAPDAQGRRVLGPPMWIAQEIYDKTRSSNPTYELVQWRWSLETAQTWRERLGLPRNPDWDACLAGLPQPTIREGKYVAMESIPDTWENAESRHDHPSFLMALGVLPGPGIDAETMRRTLHATLAQWRWEVKIWGWDYPMIAMTAARLGEANLAIDTLLKDGPNNRYLPNGHCPQRKDLGVYLPANGSFLAAVAQMVAGWDDSVGEAPGFPKDGRWKVRAEGFAKLP